MTIDPHGLEARQAKRDAEHEAAEHDRRWAMVRAGLACLGWAALGLLSFGFALHTTDRQTGEIFVWAAWLITYGGIAYTLLRAYRKGEDRGDW
ncbi:MAG TPA: hypothetical protein VN600_06075 [Gemmatimonadaceae bacterium]|nr:hypothetical protein [Gemmatimonadaceae bacterium]